MLNRPLEQILRLACLYSLVTGGLEPNFYKSFCFKIMHCYGFQYLTTLQYLSQIGWLASSKSSPFTFSAACNFFGTSAAVDNAVFTCM